MMLFLSHYRSLTTFDKFRCALAMVLMLSASVSSMFGAHELYRITHIHAQRFNNAIAQQATKRVVELLIVGNKNGMQLLATQLTHNPMITQTAIYDIHGHILAQAGHTPKHTPKEFVFSAPIHYQKVTAGYLQITFNHSNIHGPIWLSVQWLLVLFSVVMLVGAFLIFRFGPTILLAKYPTAGPSEPTNDV